MQGAKRTFLQVEKSKLFFANYESSAKYVVNQGGTSSGKTWNILDVLLTIACTEKNKVITIVGQDVPNLKKGAWRDCNNIIAGNEIYQAYITKKNEGDRLIQFHTGSLMEFTSLQDEQDAKSGKRDYLFVNEANGISYQIFWQLAIRTKEKIFLDYNPTARFWVHDKLQGREDVEMLYSDHRDNYFLTEEQHNRIESIDDDELWKVYARGITGKISGLIITNYSLVDKMPPLQECKTFGYGMDFGFTNDHTTLVDMRLAHGELWVDNPIYETGLTNDMIANKFKELGITRRDMIVADCAEPKSIKELSNFGYWVVPSVKGADSIKSGLDILRRYHINITRTSYGLIDEVQKYKWKVDRDGNTTNQPIDTFNHAIDALRYISSNRLSQRSQSSARGHLIKN